MLRAMRRGQYNPYIDMLAYNRNQDIDQMAEHHVYGMEADNIRMDEYRISMMRQQLNREIRTGVDLVDRLVAWRAEASAARST